jgi:hypothetical protein
MMSLQTSTHSSQMKTVGPANQLADVVLVFVAERAAKNLSLAVLLDHIYLAGISRCYTRFRMTSSIIPYSFPWSPDMM